LKTYPNSEVLFVLPSPQLLLALAALRVIGAAIDLADRNVEDFKNLPPLKILADTQGSGIFYPGKHLAIPLSIFLPSLYGFVASKVAISYLFIFNSPINDIREFFPRSGLEFIRSEVSTLFHQDLDLDIEDNTPEEADKFRLISHEFSKTDIQSFVNQYLNKLDAFLHFVIDPSNFTEEGSNHWGALSHYQAWLCYERIADEIILMLTDDNSYLRKTALFRVLDQPASLGSKSGSDQVLLFKRFLLPQDDNDPIASGLKEFSGPVAEYLSNLLKAIREETLQIGIDSISLKN